MIALGEEQGALDDVLKFPNISGPVVGLKRCEGLGSQGVNLSIKPFIVFGEKRINEQPDVTDAIPQGGEEDGDDVEAIKEIFAEISLFNFSREVTVGGGDDTDVYLDGPYAPHALKFGFLQSAEKLDLHGAGDLTDFIEKEGTTIGQLKSPRLGAHRAGEGALFVAEELTLHELFGDGCAVNLDKGTVFSGAVFVNSGCDQLFARAGLSGDEDGGGGGSYLLDDLVDIFHPLGLSDDLKSSAAVPSVVQVAGADLSGGDGLLYRQAKLVLVEGLGDIVESTLFERLDGGLNGAVGGDDDDREVMVEALDLLQELQPGDARHL